MNQEKCTKARWPYFCRCFGTNNETDREQTVLTELENAQETTPKGQRPFESMRPTIILEGTKGRRTHMVVNKPYGLCIWRGFDAIILMNW